MEQKAHKQKRGGGPHMQAQFCRRGMSHGHCLQPSDTRLFSLCMRTCTSDMTGSFQTSSLRSAPNSVLRLPTSQTEQLCVFWIPTLQPAILGLFTLWPQMPIYRIPLYTKRHPTVSAPLENSGIHLPMKAHGYSGLRQHQG